MFQQHLQRAMTHLPLNPVERFVLLQREDRETVTALPDWSVRNLSSLRIRRHTTSVAQRTLGAAPLSLGKTYLLRSWTLSRCFDSSARTLGPY